MATFTNATSIRLAMRAAITLMVCAELLCCGCRSPWRSWRNEEPSLEQLLMHPGPWDAEARLAQEAPPRRGGSAQGSDPSYGRGNPYAARQAAARDAAARNGDVGRADQAARGDQGSEEQGDDRADEAEFEAAYAAAPPHLRPLLKRQWDAARAHKSKQRNGEADDRADAGAEADDDAAPAVARRSRPDDAPVAFRLSDDEASEVATDDAAADEGDAAEPNDAPRVGKRKLTAQNQSEREHLRQASGSSDEGTVTYALQGAEPLKNAEQRSSKAAPSVEELAPPPHKKRARQIAQVDPVDTGAGDDVLIKPAAASGQRNTEQRIAAAENKAAPKSPRAQEPAGLVATASAERDAEPESKPLADPAAATGDAVVPAAAEQTSVAQADELGWRDHLREALRQLEAEPASASESPAEQLHRQAASRMLRLTLGELEPALKPIEGLQTHEQEFFRHEFQALHDALDPKGNPVLARRWTLALDSHRKALAHLSAVSNLEIKNANFCSDVHSYGVISKFANPHFKPNQELLLYCELDNFSAEPVKDGFETQLQGSYEIVDASGRRVADMLLPEDADICRNPRRDYFIAYRIYMPQKIEPGRYHLRLTIEDMKGRKFGQTSMDFQIVP